MTGASTSVVPGAPAVPCPRCGTAPLPGDRLCEVCGADLRGQRGSSTTAASDSAGVCRGCGHPSSPDDEGWCASWGLRRPDAADHVELAVDGGAAISDRGHVRPRNEDAVALGRAPSHGGVADERLGAVVCDGVSSTRSSELAARAAADAALDVLLRGTGVRPRRPRRLADGNVSPALAAAAAGTLDRGIAAVRPDAITRWLGADGDAEPDVVTLTPVGPGALLLCTDGLWRYLPDAAALAAVALPALHRGGPPAAVAALAAAALTAGGADNIAVAVLPVPPLQEAP